MRRESNLVVGNGGKFGGRRRFIIRIRRERKERRETISRTMVREVDHEVQEEKEVNKNLSVPTVPVSTLDQALPNANHITKIGHSVQLALD